jgi:hypothetical protein
MREAIKDILYMLWAGMTAYSLARLPKAVQVVIIEKAIQDVEYQSIIDRPPVN